MAGQETGERIGALLDELAQQAGPEARDTADELVRCLMEFYGEGLARTVRLLRSAPDGADPLAVLTADELVSDLLILHDLHPEDTATRVGRALDKVRPYLGSHAGDVEVAGLDLEAADGPTLHLRLRGSCDGCLSSTQTVRWTIEEAVARIAPEVEHIEVEGMAAESPQPALLQILPHRPDDAPGDPVASEEAGDPARWYTLGPRALPMGDRATGVTEVAGRTLLLVRLPGQLYAYRDRCPVCAASLAPASLDGELLRCAGCAAEFDVHRAGRGEKGHLEPVPLLEEDGSVRVALPGELLGAGP
ncbi:NifU family protein [Streptomyces rhizosphaerihabitans]|uniref:NifU family protein n=1 Tax=Streptomyces rhizosphaerihabitans TaxID=1266770 RepID=UPI0021BF36D7|nr:NifU family protein [Streptomyces rhizosphaerihabitans]MCT9005890.1 NifU family protein [Streptomyces rhizosphaerihabitans]